MTNTSYTFPVVTVGGLPTASVSRQALADCMVRDCLQARTERETWTPRVVLSSNGQGIALAGRDKSFAAAMSQADIIHADGMPVVFASRMTAHPLPERIATTDFFHDAARAAEAHGLKFFILGAKDGQNKAAVAAIQKMYPKAEIVGRHDGYFSAEADDEVCAEIRASGADVLWVALGKPRQEHWALRNKHKLKGVGWIKTCGGLYAFLAGDAPRAPEWMQKAGLEWLFRAAKEPRRLAFRYVVTNPYSLFRLLTATARGS
ncbi:WecB/TagA/CpsF family glycosyltransferase [Stenotrophomonas cyclobalanopsidis]|uniref:WecB/TagA/CpsF family glycosyltransferase n=1 Tax=Stenotrophomonas cyclobalanopsidis TaxID=2771362 RepID=UPI002FDA8271